MLLEARNWTYIDNWRGLHLAIEESVRREFKNRQVIRVLEAGCGTKWPLELDDLPLHITGIDSSPAAIGHRMERSGDLDDHVIGDLVSAQLPRDSFDIIYCSYVLEHVANAESVLENFVQWLNPGGLLVIKIPDRNSVFGFLTRITPHRVHIWYKRFVMKNPNAGKEGHDPFPTVYDPVISIKESSRFIEQHGLEPIALFKTEFYPNKIRLAKRMIRMASWILHVASLGTLRADYSGLAFVVKKRSADSVDANTNQPI